MLTLWRSLINCELLRFVARLCANFLEAVNHDHIAIKKNKKQKGLSVIWHFGPGLVKSEVIYMVQY